MFKVKKAPLIACAISTALMLNGCGGGGDNSTSGPAGSLEDNPVITNPSQDIPVITPATTESSIDVTVIDGYIRGAIAYVDLNGNYIKDEGEPTGITSEGGRVTITSTDIDLSDAIIVVDIPVGAIDEDTITESNPTGVPITEDEAYQLVSLPGETIVTPLTTLILMTALMSAEDDVNAEEIQAAKEKVAESLGLTETEITADYIENENEGLAEIAALMVENEVIPKKVTENVTPSDVLVASVVTEKIAEVVAGVNANDAVIQAIAESVTKSAHDFVEANQAFISEVNFTNILEAVTDASVEAFDELVASTETITAEQIEITQQYSQVASNVVAKLHIDEITSGTAITEHRLKVATQSVHVIKASVIEQIEESTNSDAEGNLTIEQISNIAELSSKYALEKIEALLDAGLGQQELAEALVNLEEEAKVVSDSLANTVKNSDEEIIFDDLDGDGYLNNDEIAANSDPLDVTDLPKDTDGDKISDATDTDIDGDGVSNELDAFEEDASESIDSDGDGIGNNADNDDDNDGLLDGNDPEPQKYNQTAIDELSFADESLAACINEQYPATTLNDEITSLDCSDKEIIDLSGIERLINLQILYLSGNQITDISILTRLPLVQSLTISAQYVTDLTVLNVMNSLIEAYDEDGSNLLANGGENLKAASLVDISEYTSGKLEYKYTNWSIPTAIEKGRLTISFFKERYSIHEGLPIDAYIGLGTNNSSVNSSKFIDLRIHGAVPSVEIPTPDYGTIEQRDGAGLEKIAPAVVLTAINTVIVNPVGTQYNEGEHYELDAWHELEITWDSTKSSEQLTVTMDGVIFGPFDSSGGLTAVTGLYIKFGTNASIVTKEFQVDDIVIYSLDSGAEVRVFSEYFEDTYIGVVPEGAHQTEQVSVADRI